MGSSNWSGDAYNHLKRTNSTKSTNQIFTNNVTKTVATALDPKGLKFRESRDSEAHPESLAVIVNLDVTGSMGEIPETLVRTKLGTLMDTIIQHGIIDAHIMFNAIGDHYSDAAPLQVGQFETGADEITKCLSSIYLEGNGGGQGKESYLLAWLIAARHTSIDCFEKRGQKGILFTIGDEECWESISADRQQELLGYTEASEVTAEEILKEAQRLYHVFHIHLNHNNRSYTGPEASWKKLLGERLIVLDDYNNVAEVIASTVAMVHGIDLDTVTKNFSPAIAASVKNALVKVDTSVSKQSTGVINL